MFLEVPNSVCTIKELREFLDLAEYAGYTNVAFGNEAEHYSDGSSAIVGTSVQATKG
jgi:hypothetical protein